MSLDGLRAALVGPESTRFRAPLCRMDGLAVTIGDAGLARRRGTPLVLLGADPGPDPSLGGAGGLSADQPVVRADVGAQPDTFDVWACGDGEPDMRALDEPETVRWISEVMNADVPRAPRPALVSSPITEFVPFDLDGPYDVDALLATIVDDGPSTPFFAHETPEMRWRLARLGGHGVAIAASDPTIDQGRLSATALAAHERFVRYAEARGLPIVSLVDSAGIAVGAADDLEGFTALSAALGTVYRASSVWVSVLVGRVEGLAAQILGAVGSRSDHVLAWPRANLSSVGGGDRRSRTGAFTAASSGELLELIEPDQTRAVLVEHLELARGQRRYGPLATGSGAGL